MTKHIQNIVNTTIHQIWTKEGPNKAVLAALRNSSSLLDHDASAVWPLMLPNMDKNDLSYNGQPTYAEKAVYVALRCYALYQQGNDHLVFATTRNEQDSEGQTLFSAFSLLRTSESTSKPIDRRVQTILGNSNFESVTNAIYHLISIFKSNYPNEKIDFAQLAEDLFCFQLNSELSRQICLKWGQEYYWHSHKQDNNEENN